MVSLSFMEIVHMVEMPGNGACNLNLIHTFHVVEMSGNGVCELILTEICG